MNPDQNLEAQDAASQTRHAGRRWELTQEALDCFLKNIAPDRDAAAARYIQIHQNLIRFFEWRGCPYPEDHADETISRVARRLVQGEEIRDPATYAIGVARFLLLEIGKEREKERRTAAEQLGTEPAAADSAELEHRVECLRRCLEKLSPGNRELILQYYEGEKSVKVNNRKRLTEKLNLSVNTLRMRALRIRESLAGCMESCVSKFQV